MFIIFNYISLTFKSTEEQRKEFPNYFKGIQTISDYGQKIDDLLKQMENSSDSIDNLKKKSGKF